MRDSRYVAVVILLLALTVPSRAFSFLDAVHNALGGATPSVEQHEDSRSAPDAAPALPGTPSSDGPSPTAEAAEDDLEAQNGNAPSSAATRPVPGWPATKDTARSDPGWAFLPQRGSGLVDSLPEEASPAPGPESENLRRWRERRSRIKPKWGDLTKGGEIPSDAELDPSKKKKKWVPGKDWKQVQPLALDVRVTTRASNASSLQGIEYDPAGQWLPFAQVLVVGDTFHRSRVQRQSCFRIVPLDTAGGFFAKGVKQRAFFTGELVHRRGSSSSIVEALAIKYDFKTAYWACYFLETPGLYELSVYLEFTNAFELVQDRNGSFVEGFARHQLVARSDVSVQSAVKTPAVKSLRPRKRMNPFSPFLPRYTWEGWGERGDPPCSLRMLFHSHNRGLWRGQQWQPLHCQHRSMDLAGLLQCLDGKRILMLGDSQMRYTLGTLLELLQGNSMEEFVERGEENPRVAHGIPIRGSQAKRGSPLEPAKGGKETALMSQARYKSGDEFRFYGTFFEGFAHYRFNRAIPGGGRVAFNITYIAQLGVSRSILAPWMLNRSTVGGHTVVDDAPFDAAVVAISLHDLKHFGNHRQFSNALRVRYLPRLSALVRRPKDIVFRGLWAAQDGMKHIRHAHVSNNLRGFDFEDTAVKVLRQEGYHNFISTRFMTSPRRDLCLDSTHYSWPVSFASLDIIFPSLCLALSNSNRTSF